MLRSIRSICRLIGIARTLRRHDVLTPLREAEFKAGPAWALHLLASGQGTGRPGERLTRALTELGPSFIKLGQVLSTRADLIGATMAEDLSALQDRLPPFSAREAKETVEAELGRPLDQLFADFEDDPISAASIAQVHLAVTSEGAPVAVKVLRPEIERAFERDLEFLTWLATLVERTQPRLRRFKPRQVVELFERQVRLEMDLRMEAAAASELAENFRDDPGYRTPAVDWERTSRRILTMERLHGIPMDDRTALVAAGHDLEAILAKAAEIFFKQVFRDGFFHGDQHPGNMLVDGDGNIVAVDFGIMGRLDHKTRAFLADMLIATLARDYRALAQVHIEAGYLPRGPQVDTFAQALRSVCEPIMGKPLSEISFARLLAQLLQLTESFNMPVQPSLLILQKNMLIAEGISRLLVPGLNIWTLAQPMIEDWVRDNRSPEARIRETADAWLERLQRLPQTLDDLEKVAQSISRGGLRLDPAALAVMNRSQRASRRHIAFVWWAIAALAMTILWIAVAD